MSITLESSPPLVAISGNAVRFKLSSDNKVETTGIQTEANVTFFTVGSADDTFTIEFDDNSITFTCKTSPDDSGLQIPTSPANLADWVAVVAIAVGLNYLISESYSVTSSGPDLIFSAREKGSGKVITLEEDWTGTPPSLIQTEGTDQVERVFFKLGLQVLISEDSAFTKISEDYLPLDSNDEASFDIHKIFADQLESEFKFPDASDQLVILRENMCREYVVRYFERFGSDLAVQKMTQSDSFFVLNAGVSHLQEAIYNRQDSSLWDKLTYNNYFLTWQPKSKYIDRYQTEKLYFLLQSDIDTTSLRLRIEVNYNDDTAQFTFTKKTISLPTDKGVYEVALTLNTLQLPGYDDDTIDYFRVWFHNQDSDRISEIRTYTMDYNHYEKVRYFLFRNSLGGFDTLRITGDVTDGIEFERTDISKVLGEDFTEQNHQQATGDVKEIKTYQANTGWKSEEAVSWIRDFLLSKQAYQMIAGKLVPILITSSNAMQRADRQDLFSISFEYRRAFKNEFYTKQIVNADFNDDFDDDFVNE